MATRRPASEPSPTNLDFRATADDAWWSVQVHLEGESTLRVCFCGFPDDFDERFKAESFQTAAEVEYFRGRFRPSPVQLQDSECEMVIEGMELCASYAFREDDICFYDAIVEEVNFSEHRKIEGEERCTCSFEVLWQHGPLAGEKSSIGIENICLRSSRGLNMDPVLDHFLNMAKKKCQKRKLESGPTVSHSFVSSRLGHESTRHNPASSDTRVASSNGKIGSTDGSRSKKPRLSPSHIEEPESYDPVWTYCHAFMQPSNQVECSFCGRTFACSLNVKSHLARFCGNAEPCLKVHLYWSLFYSRYICVSRDRPQKLRPMIAAKILHDLDAEVEAGRMTLPPDRETVTAGSSPHPSSSLIGSSSSSRIPPVPEHPFGEDEGMTTEKIKDGRENRRLWEERLRMRMQRFFKNCEIPHRVVCNPDFEAVCRCIAAAAKAGHVDILPSQEELDIWVLSDSEDEYG